MWPIPDRLDGLASLAPFSKRAARDAFEVHLLIARQIKENGKWKI
jgi:hypothetical protein